MSFAKIRYAALTDVGVKRSHNQDACAAQPAADESHWLSTGHIFIVADGMGGHAVGEKASALAVRGIPLTFQKHVTQDGVVAAIRRAFRETNASIFEIGVNNPEFKGLGTTGTALFLRPDGAWIGHVGDSRAYRIRAGKVEQLTFDHSWVWEIARRQGIDPDELGDFKKNVIVRSLGPDADVEADIEGPHPMEPGDTFLLCSDGLTNQVPADEIGAVVSAMPPDEAAKFLIELANVRGGPDNITCVIAQIPGQPSDKPAGAGPKKPRFEKLRKALKAWDKVVPWSYTFLGLGCLLAAVSMGLRIGQVPGAIPLFFGAAGLILAGIVGLAMHFVRKGSASDSRDSNETSGELHVYKGYTFDVGTPLLDRMAEVEAALVEALRERPESIDWAAHERLSAEVAANAANPLAAFRARCKAVQMLATVFNKDRHKTEAFQPNWTSKGG